MPLINNLAIRGRVVSDINGIIESYKVDAGSSISAGDFVEFVEKRYSESSSTIGINVSNSDYHFPISLVLDSNHALVLSHNTPSGSEYEDNSNSAILTLISIGDSISNLKIESSIVVFTSDGDVNASMIKLSSGNVIITYIEGLNLYARLISISSSYTLSASNPMLIVSGTSSSSPRFSSLSEISDSKVVVTYGSSRKSSVEINSLCLSISSTSISVPNLPTTVVVLNNAGSLKSLSLGGGIVLITYLNDSNIKFALVSVDTGTGKVNIKNNATGTMQSVPSNSYYNYDILVLSSEDDNTELFLSYNYENNFSCKLIRVSDTIIDVSSTPLEFASSEEQVGSISNILLEDGRIYVGRCISEYESNSIYGDLFKIVDGTIIKENNDSYISVTNINPSNIEYLRGSTICYSSIEVEVFEDLSYDEEGNETLITYSTSSLKFHVHQLPLKSILVSSYNSSNLLGVAVSSGNEGSTIQVRLPSTLSL